MIVCKAVQCNQLGFVGYQHNLTLRSQIICSGNQWSHSSRLCEINQETCRSLEQSLYRYLWTAAVYSIERDGVSALNDDTAHLKWYPLTHLKYSRERMEIHFNFSFNKEENIVVESNWLFELIEADRWNLEDILLSSLQNDAKL